MILVSWIVCAVVLGLISSVEFSWVNETRMAITKHFWILFNILANGIYIIYIVIYDKMVQLIVTHLFAH